VIAPEEMAELARRIAVHRDRAAFERLFDHFAPRLNGYLQRLGADQATAEEIAQEAEGLAAAAAKVAARLAR